MQQNAIAQTYPQMQLLPSGQYFLLVLILFELISIMHRNKPFLVFRRRNSAMLVV